MNWGFVIANGVTLACIYGTLAIGISITWSSLGLINLAYGFIFAMSGYGAWLAAQYLSANGFLVMGAGILTGAIGGLLVCALAFIPIHDKPNFTVRGMIATLAISLIGNQALLWYFGPRSKSLPSTVRLLENRDPRGGADLGQGRRDRFLHPTPDHRPDVDALFPPRA